MPQDQLGEDSQGQCLNSQSSLRVVLHVEGPGAGPVLQDPLSSPEAELSSQQVHARGGGPARVTRPANKNGFKQIQTCSRLLSRRMNSD